MPFIHPKGMIIWNQLIDYPRETSEAWLYRNQNPYNDDAANSGNAPATGKNYRENMFTSQIEERDFAIKPMNCPGCMLYYRSAYHSYRELPLRVAEIGNVHRYEPSGSLSGLFRVRSFHQDDAHIFMKPSDIQSEILNVLNWPMRSISTFGLHISPELSTSPDKQYDRI